MWGKWPTFGLPVRVCGMSATLEPTNSAVARIGDEEEVRYVTTITSASFCTVTVPTRFVRPAMSGTLWATPQNGPSGATPAARSGYSAAGAVALG